MGAYSYISTKCDSNDTISRNILNKALTIEDFHSTNALSDMYIDEPKNYLNYMQKEFSAPVFLFAGEACHDKYFSTAHGAFLSGMEQAQKIIKLYK